MFSKPPRMAPSTIASIAQLVEHALRKRTVVGSIPTGGSFDPMSAAAKGAPLTCGSMTTPHATNHTIRKTPCCSTRLLDKVTWPCHMHICHVMSVANPLRIQTTGLAFDGAASNWNHFPPLLRLQPDCPACILLSSSFRRPEPQRICIAQSQRHGLTCVFVARAKELIQVPNASRL